MTSTWLHSYRHSSRWASGKLPGGPLALSEGVYRVRHAGVIARLLGRCVCTVACAPDAGDVILGWVCWEMVRASVAAVAMPGSAGAVPLVHFLYVKKHVRRFGIGRMLLDSVRPRQGGLLYSALTDDAEGYLARHAEQRGAWVYDPYLIAL